MSYRGRLDEPGFMDSILEEVRNTPVEYYLDMLARYDNEKPGDIILPGVPGRVKKKSTDVARKTPRKNQKAA